MGKARKGKEMVKDWCGASCVSKSKYECMNKLCVLSLLAQPFFFFFSPTAIAADISNVAVAFSHGASMRLHVTTQLRGHFQRHFAAGSQSGSCAIRPYAYGRNVAIFWATGARKHSMSPSIFFRNPLYPKAC